VRNKRRPLFRIALIAAAAFVVAALALGYYVFFYKSPEYRRLARETDETQRALDTHGDDAGAEW
jgi:hypothetical protein